MAGGWLEVRPGGDLEGSGGVPFGNRSAGVLGWRGFPAVQCSEGQVVVVREGLGGEAEGVEETVPLGALEVDVGGVGAPDRVGEVVEEASEQEGLFGAQFREEVRQCAGVHGGQPLGPRSDSPSMWTVVQ